MRRFPYPTKSKRLTVFGIPTCPYCQKMKEIVENFNKGPKKYAIYYNIDDLIKDKKTDDYNDFFKKMRPFIGDYNLVPLVFLQGIFIGGYSDYIKGLEDSLRKQKESERLKMLLSEIKMKDDDKNIENQLEKKLRNISKKMKKSEKNEK